MSPVLKALECIVQDILAAFPTEEELNTRTNPVTTYPGWTIPTTLPGPNELPSLDYKMLVLNLQMLAANVRANHQPQTLPGITLVGLLGGRAGLWTVDGAVGRKVYLLSIVGTQTGLDAVADLAYLPVRFGLNPLHGKVHFGFDLVAQRVYADLKPYLNASSPTDQFLIMGHSLGASAAVICATRAQAEHPLRSIRLLTAATPRVGDSNFMIFMNATLPNRWHILNTNDVVPALPLAVMPGLNGTVATFESFLERNVVGQIQTDDLIGNHLPPAYACMVASQNCVYNPNGALPPPPAATFRLPTYTINRVSESTQ